MPSPPPLPTMHCGETFLLPAQAQRVVLGLQWEESHADTDLDIDVSCALLTPLGRVVDTVFARHPVYCYAHESVAVQFFEDPTTAPFAPQPRLSFSLCFFFFFPGPLKLPHSPETPL